MQILIGAGRNREKKLSRDSDRGAWSGLVTLDINPAHKPDVVHDLSVLPLPFADNSADEIHAYDVLEHIGTQGDWRFFFAQWMDFWRILKPGGVFFGITPAFGSTWTWGDPGHTRVISYETLFFLSQPNYASVGPTPMTDYRFVFPGDFDLIYSETVADQYRFALRAVKPSRIADV